MWQYALSRWSKRPLIGWGPGSTRALLEEGNSLYLHQGPEAFDHLHNAFIQILFSFGLFGLALFFFVPAVLVVHLIRAYRSGYLPPDILVATISESLLISLYSLTDIKHLNYDSRSF